MRDVGGELRADLGKITLEGQSGLWICGGSNGFVSLAPLFHDHEDNTRAR